MSIFIFVLLFSGGSGGLGGKGRKCELIYVGHPMGSSCADDGAWSRAPQDPRGSDGKAGSSMRETNCVTANE